MIRNQWYGVLDSSQVKKDQVVGVTRLGEKLVFWRDEDNQPHCVFDRCAHRGASLSQGKVAEGHIQCPFHGFEYDKTGQCVRIPANGKNNAVPDYIRVNAYPVREKHGIIWMWWGDWSENLPEIPFFEDIDENMPYSWKMTHWTVHYTRCIENQLDVVHLPFVHETTIGKGGKTIVNGPKVIENRNGFYVYVYNVKDEGQKPLKASEIPDPDPKRQHLQFIYPNLWQNYIIPQMRVFISFIPVDDENSLLYMRVYQNFSRLPLIRGFLNTLTMMFSMIILNQDRRVVNLQLPKQSEYKMKEDKLIPGDYPIVVYRRMREELKNGGNK